MSRLRRRQFLFTAGTLLIAPVGALGQSAGRMRRIGWLFGSSREAVAAEMETFVTRLQELGHVPGRTVEIVPRFAGGAPARLPELARELVDQEVEVVFVPNTQGALALQRLSDRLAIIFVAADPVAAGLAASLARPGRNATGFTQGAATIATKRVDLLKEAFPSVRKPGVLFDSKYPVQEPTVIELVINLAAAREQGLTIPSSILLRADRSI